MVRRPYIGAIRVGTLGDTVRKGRYKLDFGPRAVLRGSHARGIFLGKSLSKVADNFEPYPTNIPYIRGTCGTCTSSGW
jgi:hypothetical protein